MLNCVLRFKKDGKPIEDEGIPFRQCFVSRAMGRVIVSMLQRRSCYWGVGGRNNKNDFVILMRRLFILKTSWNSEKLTC